MYSGGGRWRGSKNSSGFGRGSRSSYRGRGDRFWHRADPTQWQTQGEIVTTISADEIIPSLLPSTISNVEYVASYSWLDQKSPTILIPGSPPVWAPPADTPKLNQDSGDVYRDQNAARYPRHPLEPAIRAIFAMQPDLQPREVDVVACGSTLGNLLRFTRSLDVNFRFDVQFIGKTIFFLRKENSPKELIEGLYGYGHTFPESYTNWETDVKGSVSHQRINQYQFGGLKFLVRFESDGWLRERLDSKESDHAKDGTDLRKAKHDSPSDAGISSLLQATGTIRVSMVVPVVEDGLKLKLGGRMIPHKAIFDLKTRAATRSIDMDDILPRLWVSQTPNLIIGYHQSGYFDDIQIRDVRAELQTWEKENETALMRLSALLHRIIELAKASGGHGLEISHLGNGPLVVRRLLDGGWHALPPDLREKWAKGQEEQESLRSPSPLSESASLDDKTRDLAQELKELSPKAVASASGSDSEEDQEYFSTPNYDRWDNEQYREDESERDYTACSAEDCGYCGKCSY